ncbi:Protein F44E7.7, partial [Aphelenchoides avenae]
MDENQNIEKVPVKRSIFGNYSRFVILTISTLCLTAVVSNSMALNFTVICMSPPAEEIDVNGTTEWASTPAYGTYGVPRLTTAQESYLFSAVAIGQLIGVIPLPQLTTWFGFRKVFTVFGVTSCLSTFFLPLMAKWGFPALMVARIVQ